MYWLNGVPRVYAVNGPGIPLTSTNNHEVSSDELGEDERVQLEKPEALREDQEPSTAWVEEVIQGLCVSRNGHLFATITGSSIAIWQTKVIRSLFSCLFVAKLSLPSLRSL
jgi:RAB6A-GEF complex partner protein 1